MRSEEWSRALLNSFNKRGIPINVPSDRSRRILPFREGSNGDVDALAKSLDRGTIWEKDHLHNSQRHTASEEQASARWRRKKFWRITSGSRRERIERLGNREPI